MIFWGKIWDKIFEKVPHRFLEKFWRQKFAEYLSIKQKNQISGTSLTFGATRI